MDLRRQQVMDERSCLNFNERSAEYIIESLKLLTIWSGWEWKKGSFDCQSLGPHGGVAISVNPIKKTTNQTSKGKKEFKGSKFESETMSGVHEGNCFSPVPRLSAADRLYLSASDHD